MVDGSSLRVELEFEITVTLPGGRAGEGGSESEPAEAELGITVSLPRQSIGDNRSGEPESVPVPAAEGPGAEGVIGKSWLTAAVAVGVVPAAAVS